MSAKFIQVTIPVFNEEWVLAGSVEKLQARLQSQRGVEWEIVIANNASTDRTLEIAREVEERHENVRVIHLEEKGRGRALKQAWQGSTADILCYMDVDLSTDTGVFRP